MKKYILSILVILLLITSITSVTYAWFTYVHKKSLATFEAGFLGISLFKDEVEVAEDIVFDDIVFIDYQDDFINNEDGLLNQIASTHRFDLELHEDSPQSKVYLSLSEVNTDGLIYIIIYEGLNLSLTDEITTDYALLINSIIAGYNTKEEQMAAINLYNYNVSQSISQQVFSADDKLTYQIVAWGDYDALDDQAAYMDTVFELTLSITVINSKGEVTP